MASMRPFNHAEFGQISPAVIRPPRRGRGAAPPPVPSASFASRPAAPVAAQGSGATQKHIWINQLVETGRKTIDDAKEHPDGPGLLGSNLPSSTLGTRTSQSRACVQGTGAATAD